MCTSDGLYDTFSMKTSGSCSLASLIQPICDKARTALGLAATSVTSQYSSSYPYGCVFSNHGSYVYLNTYKFWYNHVCGYNGMACLCKLGRFPACAWQNGSAPHTSSYFCSCGNTVCSSETGMTCTSANSTCDLSIPCEFTKGLELNTNVCRCGSIDCTMSTGFYCYAAKSTCSVDGFFNLYSSLTSSSKSCTQIDDGSWITDAQACEKAIRTLGYNISNVLTTSSQDRPYGCISNSQGT